MLPAMVCEHSHWEQCVPFFASSICEHLRVLCEWGLTGWVSGVGVMTERDGRVMAIRGEARPTEEGESVRTGNHWFIRTGRGRGG